MFTSSPRAIRATPPTGRGSPPIPWTAAGNISPQGFVSTALSEPPSGLRTESEAAATDLSVTVNMIGSGTGTVTSDPAGINCLGRARPVSRSASRPAQRKGGGGLGVQHLRRLRLFYFRPVWSVDAHGKDRHGAVRRFRTGAPPNYTLTVTRAGTELDGLEFPGRHQLRRDLQRVLRAGNGRDADRHTRRRLHVLWMERWVVLGDRRLL